MDERTGYLCNIIGASTSVIATTVLVVGADLPHSELIALDFKAHWPDSQCIVMAVTQNAFDGSSIHKVGMSLPISETICAGWSHLPIATLSISGDSCSQCRKHRAQKAAHAARLKRFGRRPSRNAYASKRLAVGKALQRYLVSTLRSMDRTTLPGSRLIHAPPKLRAATRRKR